jgi:hypothetical protein
MDELYSPQLAGAIEVSTFDLAEFKDEIRRAPHNRQIGSKLWYSNDRVNVWEVALQPGERAAFHTHAIEYFWVCVDGGEGRQRYPDGSLRRFRFSMGDVDFVSGLSETSPAVHDLENVDARPIRFVAVELKR